VHAQSPCFSLQGLALRQNSGTGRACECMTVGQIQGRHKVPGSSTLVTARAVAQTFDDTWRWATARWLPKLIQLAGRKSLCPAGAQARRGERAQKPMRAGSAER